MTGVVEQAWRDYTDGVSPEELPEAYAAFKAGRDSRQPLVSSLRKLLREYRRRGVQLARTNRIAGEAWNMTHWGCDNPDHAEAYKLAATVFAAPDPEETP